MACRALIPAPPGQERKAVVPTTANRTKKACSNCRTSKGCCSESRPCRRCVRLGIEDTCDKDVGPGVKEIATVSPSKSAVSQKAQKSERLKPPSASLERVSSTTYNDPQPPSLSSHPLSLPYPPQQQPSQFSPHHSQSYSHPPQFQFNPVQSPGHIRQFPPPSPPREEPQDPYYQPHPSGYRPPPPPPPPLPDGSFCYYHPAQRTPTPSFPFPSPHEPTAPIHHHDFDNNSNNYNNQSYTNRNERPPFPVFDLPGHAPSFHPQHIHQHNPYPDADPDPEPEQCHPQRLVLHFAPGAPLYEPTATLYDPRSHSSHPTTYDPNLGSSSAPSFPSSSYAISSSLPASQSRMLMFAPTSNSTHRSHDDDDDDEDGRSRQNRADKQHSPSSTTPHALLSSLSSSSCSASHQSTSASSFSSPSRSHDSGSGSGSGSGSIQVLTPDQNVEDIIEFLSSIDQRSAVQQGSRNQRHDLIDKAQEYLTQNTSWKFLTSTYSPLPRSEWDFATLKLNSYNARFLDQMRIDPKIFTKLIQGLDLFCSDLFHDRNKQKCNQTISFFLSGTRRLELLLLWVIENRETVVECSVEVNDVRNPTGLILCSRIRPDWLVPTPHDFSYESDYFHPLVIEG